MHPLFELVVELTSLEFFREGHRILLACTRVVSFTFYTSETTLLTMYYGGDEAGKIHISRNNCNIDDGGR